MQNCKTSDVLIPGSVHEMDLSEDRKFGYKPNLLKLNQDESFNESI
jgi:hypothetical protein